MSTLLKNKIILFTLCTLLSSCVGTIEDKNAQVAANKTTGDSSKAFSFDGLVNAVGVAHDKIELSFAPADADKTAVTYEIYVNNGPIPIKVTGNSLSVNASGLYVFTVSGLSINTTYTFNMRAVLNGTSEALKLDPTKSLSATTFNNETADFQGISSLTLGAGESGRDTVIVKWIPAAIKGTALNPKNTDPVGYEITYVTKLAGARNINNPSYVSNNKKVITIPYPISNPPALNTDSQYTINGLTPGETYYFQVRALHKGYILYKTDLTYKREENTRFLSITTLNNAALFSFNAALAYMTNPLGDAGRSNLNVSWIPAAGEFNHYRLCYKQVAAPGDSEPIVDEIQEENLEGLNGKDRMIDVTSKCIPLDVNTTSHTLGGLQTYAYIQAKVIACRKPDCGPNDRQKSDLLQKRVIAFVTPFNGVLTILNPNDETKLNNINVTFDSPVISAGYLTHFTLYCYSSLNDNSPVAIPSNGTITSNTGKPSCNGIRLLTPLPSAFADYGILTNLEVELPVVDGNSRYCFSLLPSIRSQYLIQEDLSTAVVKCVTPEIKTPTIVQFPGREDVCNINGRNLTINWPTPTGGLFTKFVVFYKEKTASSTFFNFEEAKSAYLNNNNAVYKWVDGLPRDSVEHIFTNLIQGRSYNVGVLSYLEANSTKLFSQFNVNIGQCTMPLPVPTFNEWVDIFAIGPKEDGLTPIAGDGSRKYILETLDNDGIPVDIKVTTLDPKVIHPTDEPLAATRAGTVNFDGIYGSMDALATNPLNQYSNSGIVKLGWKDVTFYSGTEQLNNFIGNPTYETPPSTKTLRKFGYRVYRSDDNQMTWLDLTKNSATKFQSVNNSGLIYPSDYTWRARTNKTPTVEKIAFFTDYSVKFSQSSEEIDRARIYFYKIVPVFDGKELDYGSAGNSTHHIIKVTLPPRNMALVHRQIANRTICLEMDKPINKSAGAHYSCSFNGLGASGLSLPWAVGNTVYDLGGDLLIDRFELSCPFTRGDMNIANSSSSFNLGKLAFKGESQYATTFRGCYNSTSTANLEGSAGSTSQSANYVYKQAIPGDCFGRDGFHQAAVEVCANPAFPETRYYFYPGSSDDVDDLASCGDPDSTGERIFDLTNPASRINNSAAVFPTQSEFAAVYYSRTSYNRTSEFHLNTGKLPGGNGQSLEQTSRFHNGTCSVNLNWVNSSDQYRPRWIPLSGLFERLKTAAKPSGLNLYKKKVSEVLADSSLYDSTNVKAPTGSLVASNRYKSTSTLARVVTSNSAKLPPLDGLAVSDLNGICSTYKVQVGLETASKPFTMLNNKTYDKRLMRKKESMVASAWPQSYDTTKIMSIETGDYEEATIKKGCNSLTKTLPSGTGTFSRADYLTTNFPHAGSSHTLLMTGNSSRDYNGELANTEKCVSRFGVQDMVGSLQEANSEQIFCDYSEDTLYLGTSKSPTTSVNITNTNNSGNRYDPSLIEPWVQSTPYSGMCSVVEKGGARTGEYLNSSYFAPIYNFLGNLDADVVSKSKDYDQNSVLAARNGDGSFLDFGQANLAPKLSRSNLLTMRTADLPVADDYHSILPKYFNTALGIPLLCEKGCANDASDNTLISTDQICTSKDCTTFAIPPVIQNFPMNNASITNVGTGDRGSRGDLNTNNPNHIGAGIDYISGVNTANPITDNTFIRTPVTSPEATPGETRVAYFNIGRDSSLKMLTGGNYLKDSGRHSLHVYGNNNVYERSESLAMGSRCAILINEDE